MLRFWEGGAYMNKFTSLRSPDDSGTFDLCRDATSSFLIGDSRGNAKGFFHSNEDPMFGVAPGSGVKLEMGEKLETLLLVSTSTSTSICCMNNVYAD